MKNNKIFVSEPLDVDLEINSGNPSEEDFKEINRLIRALKSKNAKPSQPSTLPAKQTKPKAKMA